MTIVNPFLTDPVLTQANREFCERVLKLALEEAPKTRPSFEELLAQFKAIQLPPGFDEVHIDAEMKREIIDVPPSYFAGFHHGHKMAGPATVVLTVKAVNKTTLSRVIAPSITFVDPWWMNKTSSTMATGANASAPKVPSPVMTKTPSREQAIESRILTIMEATAKRNAALQLPVEHTCTEMRNLLLPQTASDYTPNHIIFRLSPLQPTAGKPRFEFVIEFTDQLTGTIKVITHPTTDSWWESENLRIRNSNSALSAAVSVAPSRSEGVALRLMQMIIAAAAGMKSKIGDTKTVIDTQVAQALPVGYKVMNIRWHHRNHPTYNHKGLTLGFSDSAFVVEGTDNTGADFIIGCKATQAWWEAEHIRWSSSIPTSADLRTVMERVRDECDTQGKMPDETCAVMMDYLNHAMALYNTSMTVNTVMFQDIGTPGNPDLAFVATIINTMSILPITISVNAPGNWWTWCMTRVSATAATVGVVKTAVPVKDLAPKEPLFNVSVMRQIVLDELEQCARDGEDRANTKLRIQNALKPFLSAKHSVEWVSIDRDAANPKHFNLRVGVLDHTNAAEDESGEGVLISVTLPILQPWWN